MLKVVLDIDRDYTFDNALDDLSEYTLEASWNYGGVTKLGYVGTYAEMLPPSRSTIRLVDRTGAFNLKDSSATHHGKLKRGVLVRIQALSVFDLLDSDGDTLVDGDGDTLTDVLQYKQLAEHRIFKVDGTGKLPDGARMITIYAEDPTSNWSQQDYIPRLQKNIRIDEVIADTIDDLTLSYPYPLSGSIVDIAIVNISTLEYSLNFIDFEQARTTLDFAGDLEPTESSVMAHLVQHLSAEGGGRLFWNRDGKLRFHDRYHDFIQSEFIKLTDDDIEEIVSENSPQLVNHMTVNYAVREIGSSGSKIAEASNLPMKIDQGSYKSFRLPFRSFSTDQKIASDNVIYPVVGVDVVCEDAASGGLVDNNFVWVGVSRIGARDIELSVFNDSTYGDSRSKDRWLTKLEVRGDPLVSYDRQALVVFDAPSIQQNGRYSMVLEYPVIQDATFAQGLGLYTLNRYKTTVQTVQNITLSVYEQNLPSLCLMDIGKILRINSVQENIYEDYVVIGQEWQVIADNSQRSMVIVHVKPVNREPLAVCDKAIVNLTSATTAL